MKIRNSFVTNSSSSSFCISNRSNRNLTIKDLMKDWKNSIKSFYEEETKWASESFTKYSWGKQFIGQFPTFEDFFNKVLEDADVLYDKEIKPRESIELECGDHQSVDGYASYFIHGTWSDLFPFTPYSENFDVEFLESHH